MSNTVNSVEILSIIEKRWSPRAFSNNALEAKEVKQIFTAASWAASANNEQPWSYIYALNGTSGFENLWNCLSEGNKPWTKNVPLIFVALYRTTFKRNGKPNPWALHDLGMANSQLLLQAASHDIYGHLMAGFDADKTKQVLELDVDLVPACFGVLGYLGDPDSLEEPYKSREKAERTRIGISEFVKQL